MKKALITYLLVLPTVLSIGQSPTSYLNQKLFERIRIESRIPGLELSILHLATMNENDGKLPVLFVHGASFPSALAFGFRMENYSWMDNLSDHGYQVFALDQLGYGESDCYPKMSNADNSGDPLGTGKEVIFDIERAVEYILKNTGSQKLNLIGHSWGATVSGYYATLHPEQIEKLVLFAPFVQREGPVNWHEPDYPYLELTPEERVAQFYKQLPGGQDTVLEKDVIKHWGSTWLLSDKHSQTENRNYVRYPAGWKRDLYLCWTGGCLFEPKKVIVPALVIRGEWDTALSAKDAEWLFDNLSNSSLKRYVVIEKATHVAHLEKSRDQLYAEVELFISQKIK